MLALTVLEAEVRTDLGNVPHRIAVDGNRDFTVAAVACDAPLPTSEVCLAQCIVRFDRVSVMGSFCVL